ncbi:hypothetical protein FB561_1945 [Kribbella amoyensis]|uniref:DUF3558 domain-containing protein n=1 Tax=Kribbella amoyensis TaxID=996641 RepID=A0A561BPP2_9ACTN|nr:hypothetical protein [Kribbella amoyensis]TWD80849.1 hypothetical protein FB561_1945 [Kribbella amoyensis]
MAKVTGVARRVVRGTAIACGVAAVAGVGFGFAAGKPVSPDEIAVARKLPGDLCERIGDISALLPKATTPAALVQTGSTEVHCHAEVAASQQTTYTSGTLDIYVTPHAGKQGGANQPPLRPDTIARQAFDRETGQALKDRPYPTKVDRSGRTGGQDWSISVAVVRDDLVVRVEYSAHPVTKEKAEQAALVIADRAIWEAK